MSKQSFKRRILGSTKRPSSRANIAARRRMVERDLINAESALGRTLFGEIKQGHAREFFCLKKNVWLWYENGVTIRYEVRENGVFKQIGKDAKYQKVTGAELENFRNAIKAYLKLIKDHIYKY